MPDSDCIAWKTVRLGDEELFEFESGIWTGDKAPLVETAILRNTNFGEEGDFDYSNVAKIEIESRLLSRKKLVPGDIVIERSGGSPTQPVGRVAYFDKPDGAYCFSNFTSRLRVRRPELVDSRFLHLFLLLLHASGQTEALQRRTTGIRNLDFNEYLKKTVPLPPLSEQQAIVYILRTIRRARDARLCELSLERERRVALRNYLLTYGALGEERKDISIGKIPQSWDVKTLLEVADLYSGGTPSKARPEWWDGSIPWVSTKDLKKPRLTDVTDHVTEEAVREGSRLAPAMSLFIGVRGMILAKEIPICLAEVPMAFNQDVKAAVPHRGVNPEFLLYALNFRKEALNPHVGTSAHGTRRISSEIVASLELPIPSDSEQSQIAAILTACDRRISALEQEHELLGELFYASLEELLAGRIDIRALIENGVSR